MRQRSPAGRTAAHVTLGAVLLLASCGDDGGSDATTTTASAVEQAEARVSEAQEAVDRARSDLDEASAQFCGDSADLIGLLDQFGQVLDDDSVTVGEVESGAEELRDLREEAGSSADAALEARAALDEANAELADAEAELAAARVAVDGGATTTTTTATAPSTTAPLVPADMTARVRDAEEALAATAESIDESTPVVEASVRLQSAAFAVEVSWLQLFSAAGCLDDEEQAAAIQSVIDYTAALQAELQAAGLYPGPVDGIYGVGTVDAVEQLQEGAGLPMTGLLDPPSERALAAAVEEATGTALAGATTHTAAVQGALKVLGYWDGPVDGAASPELDAAVARLQEDLGVEPTGIVDTATLRALEDALAEAQASETTTTTTTTIAG